MCESDFYAVRYPLGTSAASPNFSSPLRSPMKNFQRSQTRAKPVLCSEIYDPCSRVGLSNFGCMPGGRCPQGHPVPKCFREFKRQRSCIGNSDFGYTPEGRCHRRLAAGHMYRNASGILIVGLVKIGDCACIPAVCAWPIPIFTNLRSV